MVAENAIILLHFALAQNHGALQNKTAFQASSPIKLSWASPSGLALFLIMVASPKNVISAFVFKLGDGTSARHRYVEDF
jgi:hypothetical protein